MVERLELMAGRNEELEAGRLKAGQLYLYPCNQFMMNQAMNNKQSSYPKYSSLPPRQLYPVFLLAMVILPIPDMN
jgi:hypothetical protein